jgi:hypothetical protein
MPKVITVDLMLLNWSETANGGAKVVFQLADSLDLDQFKALTLAKGKRAGQLFAAALALIEEPSDPKWQKKGPQPRCALVCQWCQTDKFRAWLSMAFPEIAANVSVNDTGEEWAAQVVRTVLGITSRADIDGNPSNETNFDRLLREPYREYLIGEVGTHD